MKVLVIDGDPRKNGRIGQSLECIAGELRKSGLEVGAVRLADARIDDCLGCLACLKTGTCDLADDMPGIVRSMQESDGLVVGAPVRNALPAACYKRFYERITFVLGFPRLLEEKYTVAVSCVGILGGKGECRRLVGLQDVCGTRLTDYVFSAAGIPGRPVGPADRERLALAARRLVADLKSRPAPGLFRRLSDALDRLVMRKAMFDRNPETFAHVIECWKKKGYM